MTTRAEQIEVPQNWPGSLPEYVAYITFEQLGKVPGEDFSYQSSRMGGRLDPHPGLSHRTHDKDHFREPI